MHKATTSPDFDSRNTLIVKKLIGGGKKFRSSLHYTPLLAFLFVFLSVTIVSCGDDDTVVAPEDSKSSIKSQPTISLRDSLLGDLVWYSYYESGVYFGNYNDYYSHVDTDSMVLYHLDITQYFYIQTGEIYKVDTTQVIDYKFGIEFTAPDTICIEGYPCWMYYRPNDATIVIAGFGMFKRK